MEVDLIVVPDELEDGDVEATGEGHAVLCHPNGVILNVWTPRDRETGIKGVDCLWETVLLRVVVLQREKIGLYLMYSDF